jgi:Transposase
MSALSLSSCCALHMPGVSPLSALLDKHAVLDVLGFASCRLYQRYFCFPFGAFPFRTISSLPQCGPYTTVVTMLSSTSPIIVPLTLPQHSLSYHYRHVEVLHRWLQEAQASGIAELRSFAAGIYRDYDAVRAALWTEYSNGQTEGQVNRLKLLKRQAYGRAQFDLLRLRLLHRSGSTDQQKCA